MSDKQADFSAPPMLEYLRPKRTGRVLVVFREGTSTEDQRQILERSFPSRSARAEGASAGSALTAAQSLPAYRGGDVQLFESLGVGLVTPDSLTGMASVQGILSESDVVIEARPEYYLYAIAAHVDDNERTWGLDATGVTACPFTGKGIKLAILDTGINRRHPDFVNRTIVEKLFVDASNLADKVGHGTHCAGTAVGPRLPGTVAPGYGCAPDADLYVGKVLNDEGFAEEGSVAAGIEWAIAQGCHVVSLSLGREVRPDETPAPFYERLGKIALDAGCLVVAASGNDSERTSGFIAPVSEPANAPSIMAVGAVDPALRIAFFSNGGVNPAGGSLDIVGPGTSVFSSFIAPKDYEILMGTSMACPHVAGIAALWAESDPSLRGRALWDAMIAAAKPLGLPKRDGGAGLVQAPSKPADRSPDLIA